jgi:hypothetical protein
MRLVHADHPSLTVAKGKRIFPPLKNPSDTEHVIDGLFKAGLPEL